MSQKRKQDNLTLEIANTWDGRAGFLKAAKLKMEPIPAKSFTLDDGQLFQFNTWNSAV